MASLQLRTSPRSISSTPSADATAVMPRPGDVFPTKEAFFDACRAGSLAESGFSTHKCFNDATYALAACSCRITHTCKMRVGARLDSRGWTVVADRSQYEHKHKHRIRPKTRSAAPPNTVLTRLRADASSSEEEGKLIPPELRAKLTGFSQMEMTRTTRRTLTRPLTISAQPSRSVDDFCIRAESQLTSTTSQQREAYSEAFPGPPPVSSLSVRLARLQADRRRAAEHTEPSSSWRPLPFDRRTMLSSSHPHGAGHWR